MTCNKVQTFLPDMILDPAQVPAEARQHLEECSNCQNDWQELQRTMQLLDAWKAPAPSQYFDVRLAARLREERQSPAPGWWERMRTRILLDSNLHLRPVTAAALALLLVVGGGSYAGFVSLNRTVSPPQHVSATVKDLELLDSNVQTFQQLAAFDDTDTNNIPAASVTAN